MSSEPKTSASVVVNLSEERGPVKLMHAVNNGPALLNRGGDQVRGNFEEYAAARIPFARTHDSIGCCGNHCVDISAIFPNFDADVDDPHSYDFICTDTYLDNIVRTGTQVFFRLGQTIEHGPVKYGVLPPKDPKKWAQICEHVVRHYNEGWAWNVDVAPTSNPVEWSDQFKIKYWEIWNEPDLDASNDNWRVNPRTWGGSEEQFFELFDVTARLLKEKHPDIKVGGPAVSGSRTWSDAFLARCHAAGTPLDFFSWHIYSKEPAKIARRAAEFKEILEKNGYGAVESILNEWNYVKGWSDEWVYTLECESGRFNQKVAAFIAGAFCVGQTAPVDMLMFYDARVTTVMNSLFDRVTLRPLKGYYPFYAWSKLFALGTSVAVSTEAEHADQYNAAAAKGADGSAALMIARYSDDNNVVVTERVAIRIDGIDLRKARCHITDDIRTYTEIPLTLSEDGKTAYIRMMPNSFAVIEA